MGYKFHRAAEKYHSLFFVCLFVCLFCFVAIVIMLQELVVAFLSWINGVQHGALTLPLPFFFSALSGIPGLGISTVHSRDQSMPPAKQTRQVAAT